MLDKAYEEGLFYRVFTTNLIYRTPELRKREWYTEVEMSKYIAYIIDTLNHDLSISKLLNPSDRIYSFLKKRGYEVHEEAIKASGSLHFVCISRSELHTIRFFDSENEAQDSAQEFRTAERYHFHTKSP